MNAVEMKEINKKFGDLTAVNRISLDIKKGEIFGLLGPNGAGKSTTINMLCGLLTPDSGEICIAGYNIKNDLNKIKRVIGIVPQYLAIYEELTARENIRFFASLYGLKGKELNESVDKALEFTGLSDAGKKLPKHFSGGMKRRLNIACGIVHNPEIIIMDEPTVGIDPQSRNHILDSVKKLNSRGTTVIYTSHYMEEVESICSRVAIIDHGKVIAQGSKEELKSLVHDRTRFIITTEVMSTLNLKDIFTIQGVQSVNQEDNRVIIHCDKGINNIGLIIDHFNKEEIPLMGVEMEMPDLEMVFLTLTGRNLRD